MTAALPHASETLGDALVEWSSDDLSRAATIYARARDEAERHHKRCVQWSRAGRRIWRKPHAREALARRMVARIRLRFAQKFLSQAMRDWRPSGEAH